MVTTGGQAATRPARSHGRDGHTSRHQRRTRGQRPDGERRHEDRGHTARAVHIPRSRGPPGPRGPLGAHTAAKPPAARGRITTEPRRNRPRPGDGPMITPLASHPPPLPWRPRQSASRPAALSRENRLRRWAQVPASDQAVQPAAPAETSLARRGRDRATSRRNRKSRAPTTICTSWWTSGCGELLRCRYPELQDPVTTTATKARPRSVNSPLLQLRTRPQL